MRKPISQKEARALKKRVADLEQAARDQRRSWLDDWPGGVYLAELRPGEVAIAQVKVARNLGHAVVVTTREDGRLVLYALPLAEEPKP